MYLDSWISSASMVVMSAFILCLDYRLELFFSSNPAKIIYLIFYRQILRSLPLPVSLPMTDRKITNKNNEAIKTFTSPAANGTSLKKRRTSKFPQAHWDLDRRLGGGPEFTRNAVLWDCCARKPRLPGC